MRTKKNTAVHRQMTLINFHGFGVRIGTRTQRSQCWKGVRSSDPVEPSIVRGPRRKLHHCNTGQIAGLMYLQCSASADRPFSLMLAKARIPDPVLRAFEITIHTLQRPTHSETGAYG